MVHVEYLDGIAEDIESSFGFIIDNDSDMFCIEGPSGLYVMIPKGFVKSIRTIPV